MAGRYLHSRNNNNNAAPLTLGNQGTFGVNENKELEITNYKKCASREETTFSQKANNHIFNEF